MINRPDQGPLINLDPTTERIVFNTAAVIAGVAMLGSVGGLFHRADASSAAESLDNLEMSTGYHEAVMLNEKAITGDPQQIVKLKQAVTTLKQHDRLSREFKESNDAANEAEAAARWSAGLSLAGLFTIALNRIPPKRRKIWKK